MRLFAYGTAVVGPLAIGLLLERTGGVGGMAVTATAILAVAGAAVASPILRREAS